MKLQTMPLKFRVWDKENKKWLDNGDEFAIRHQGGVRLRGCIAFGWKNRFEVSQDTGLRDDEGQEIFERDILKNADGVGVVEYEAPYFQLRYNYKHTSRVIQGVIVGNVWQTPELLEEK